MKKSQQNLLKAITGESLARNKYTFYAQEAMKEGLIWIARVFEETADNERVHAKEEFELITEKAEAANTLDLPVLGKTLENLRHAAEGEKYEWNTMYPDFEKIARDEDEEKIASLFAMVKTVEAKHEERFTVLANRLEAGTLYQSETEIEWKCLNCGYIHKGSSAPGKCPLCQKPQGWYMGLGVVR